MMINCPKCGTANIRGSRFCNECGELLPTHTMLCCPMCGAMNPIGNAYCDKCDARIIPLTASSSEEERGRDPVKGLSLPTIPLEEKKEQPVGEVIEEVGAEEEAAEGWLAQLRASTTEEAEKPEPESAAEPVEPVEIPDWLRDLGPIGTVTEVTPTEEQPAAETPPEAAPEETAPAMPAPAPAEIPDWLQEIAPSEAILETTSLVAEAAPEETIPAMPAPTPAEIPDWLQEIAPSEAIPETTPLVAEAAPEETIPAMPAPAPAVIPDWLQEIAPSEEAVPEAPPPVAEAAPGETIPAMPAPAPAVIPDWLQEMASPEAAALEVTPGPSPSVPPLLEFPADAEAAVAPEWLVELQKEGGPASVPMPPVFEDVTLGKVAEAEGLARAEIPGWLDAMRPRAEEAAVAVPDEPLEIEGLLEGLRGVLAPAPEMLQVGESAPPAAASEASLARARLLQSLLTRPSAARRPETRKRGVSTAERIERWFVVAVLGVAVVGILVLDRLGYKVPILTQPDISRAQAVYDSIEGVNAGDTVLVVFEYGPAEANELDLVARPILQHLYDRGAIISIASTQPTGVAVAEALLSEIASQEQYALTHKPVDYLPGGAIGIAQLLANADTQPTRILVLAAQPTPLRWWVEQTHVRNEDVPLIAGVSAALEPAASPYVDDNAGQLKGIVSGLSGAAAYEARRGAEGRATEQLNALAVGQVMAVGLMFIGAFIYIAGGSRGRGK